jgi:hypothetical protein
MVVGVARRPLWSATTPYYRMNALALLGTVHIRIPAVDVVTIAAEGIISGE